jgi:transcriptional regulator with XRE-family HTH domain
MQLDFATLKSAREKKGLTQVQAAALLRLSQGYVSLLERGLRAPSERLKKKFKAVYELTSETEPLSSGASSVDPRELAKGLAGLGYEPLAYLNRGGRPKPERVLFAALSQRDLDARLTEALPWVALKFPNLNWSWLEPRVKQHDLQNRLGYLVNLGRQVAERQGDDRTARRLADEERNLERSLLARDDTLCHDSMTQVERSWLRENRSDEAKHWHVLTDLRAEHLPYAV